MISEAKKYGLKVPDDLAVIGFDDQPLAELMDPPMTTIDQPVEEIGKKAMELMIDFLREKRKSKPQIFELPLQLVVRDST
ncbi:HTH-type transcriptional regulator DegA [wastewater metagenome]|uniref:HTH-type transcriptional regulator DegA n=2 Tax=unclassified sequences TaxID=12908 RepID=A0A5B8RLA4_9ZZZZ|nr:HTH-type transcriptional regulator DegA [uncultured organism]